tara:strand:+ start:26271 stop:29834 length:3564 start_codon:yes stop_codon:yes gene_type:complete
MRRLVLFLLFILPLISYSQKEAAIWYFGQNAGLDFNSGAPVVLTDGQLNTYEGCASISDSAGNLLFYTNGVRVWDSSHSTMLNGNGLAGNSSSTQSAIIVQKPNNVDQYYIFTVDENSTAGNTLGGIDFSIVDMTLNGGLGGVITKNSVLLANSYEKITAVKHANNNDLWIITFFRDRFYAWLVDATGINAPIITTAGISTENDASRGYLKASPDGSRLASANFGTTPSMYLYDFNDSTGIVSNEQQLFFEDPKDNPYGVEFSLMTQKLYVTTCQFNGPGPAISPGGKLYQYDLLNSNARVKIEDQNRYTRNALQIAIDGKIYRALSRVTTGQIPSSGTNFLGVINNPELDGLACNYVSDAIDVTIGGLFPSNKVYEGLPPFVTSLFILPSISANDVCLGNNTQFLLNSTTIPTSVVWDFGDPSTGINNTSALENPTHLFSSPGIFTVTSTITIGATITVLTMDVTIYNLPIVTSPVTLTQCDDDLDGIVDFNLEEANSLISTEIPVPTITYFLTEPEALSNTNSITNPTTFSNATASTVWARIENATNCVITAEVILEVASTDIPASLMLNFYECDDLTDGDNTNGISTFDFSSATNQVLNALLPATGFTITYYETIPEALAEQNPIDPLNYANILNQPTQQIVVRADDINNSCFGLGYHVTLNVNTTPQFNLLTDVNFCENDINKTIGVENPVATYTYLWEDELGNSVGTTENISVTSGGLYTVTATDPTGINCTTNKTIQATVNAIPIVNSPITLEQCDDDLDGIIDFNLEDANSLISNEIPAPTITYFLTEPEAIANTNNIINPTTFSNATTSTVWARIENATNCVVTSEVNLEAIDIELPLNLIPPFIECDDIADGDNTNNSAIFDFSSATNDILTALLPETNLSIAYYLNQSDAISEINNIAPINFRNTSSPQDIIVRVNNTVTGCLGLATISLQVEEVPIFNIEPAATLCLFGGSVRISATNPVGDYTYVWQNSSNIVIGTDSEIDLDEIGIYTLTATDINGKNCSITKTVEITSEPVMPILNFNSNNIIYTEATFNENSITVLTDNLPASNYQFALDDGIFQSNNFFDNIEAGLHTVTIRDISNCLEANVSVSLINIPKFFTPNNDGYNDTWHVTGIEFQPTSNVYIFDRFGKLIAILDPLGPGWNGLYKGNPLPSTDYWYKVELDDGRVLKGHFSLIR